MRLFAAITPPAEVLDHLETALSMLGPLPSPAARAGRAPRGHRRHVTARSPWTPRSTWHLTLAFFGGPEWTVEALELIESRPGQGALGRPVHTVLASFPLSGGGPF